MNTTQATIDAGRVAELAAAAGCAAAEVEAIVAEEFAPYLRLHVQPPAGWVGTAPVEQVARWINDKRRDRAMTVHRHGMAIGEFVEDGRTVFVPAWANGSLDARSIADTPRFATLDEAQAAVDDFFARQLAERQAAARAREERAKQAPARDDRIALAAFPEYDPTVCWECGGEIRRGEGVLDEPMGWAHRSCVGA